jgi:predicted transcriptional regulator
MFKGVHRYLVPVESGGSVVGYTIQSQSDILRFLFNHHRSAMMDTLLLSSLDTLDLIQSNPKHVKYNDPLRNALAMMTIYKLNAIAVTDGTKLVDTFSLSDVREHVESGDCLFLQRMSEMQVTDFLRGKQRKQQIMCKQNEEFGKIMKRCLKAHVHQVWVVENSSLKLLGVVTLTDMIRCIFINTC